MAALLLSVLACLLPLGNARASAVADLPAGDASRVVEVVDGDTVVLADGTEVRLVGIQAPKLPLGRRGFVAWPLADEAKAHLADLALDRVARPHYGGLRQDRHRRALAHLVLADGTWLQAEMLKAGLARVYSFPDNRALVADMLAHEQAARTARRAIWRHPYYRIRTPEETADDVDTFQLVEGVVQAVANVGGRLYLNYGADWRTDFTVMADRGAGRLLEREGFDAGPLQGRRIRVRGWITWRNGPAIELSHPEQIERLEDR